MLKKYIKNYFIWILLLMIFQVLFLGGKKERHEAVVDLNLFIDSSIFYVIISTIQLFLSFFKDKIIILMVTIAISLFFFFVQVFGDVCPTAKYGFFSSLPMLIVITRNTYVLHRKIEDNKKKVKNRNHLSRRNKV